MTSMIQDKALNDMNGQNPWWRDTHVLAEDPQKPVRTLYGDIWRRITQDHLITAIVGLRRIGKTTLIKQVINQLFAKIDRKRIAFYAFDESGLSPNVQLMESLIEKKIREFAGGELYFFFDEVQYVDGWNACLKKYVDRYARLKFVVTGSSTLFLKTKALESLAGRILETAMYPLSFGEYLRIQHGLTEPTAEQKKDIFWEYLAGGEFPYVPKLQAWADKREYVLQWVIGKIVQSDLPKLQRIVHPEKIMSLNNILIDGSGQLVEMQNLAADMGLAKDTLTSYLSLCEQAHLIGTVFNKGIGYRTRSIRQRKIYTRSVNALVLKHADSLYADALVLRAGQIVETFVYNHLLRQGKEIFFFRRRQSKEVDFLQVTESAIMPIEVKFVNSLKRRDLDNILYYCRKEHVSSCQVITKQDAREENIDGISVHFIPAWDLL